jgi:hypothetical protein
MLPVRQFTGNLLIDFRVAIFAVLFLEKQVKKVMKSLRNGIKTSCFLYIYDVSAACQK